MDKYEALDTLRVMLANSTPDERLELLAELFSGYCEHCGDEDPDNRCQCWNDE